MITKTIALVLAMAASVFGATTAFATTINTAPPSLDAIDVSLSIPGLKAINLNGIERFENTELQQSILTEYEESVYDIPNLEYNIMGHTIEASDVEVAVDPTRIDSARTRLNIQVSADDVEVTGPLINRSFGDTEINSLSGIYDSNSDKLRINLPYRAALSLLQQ